MNYLEFKKAILKNLQEVLRIEIKRGLNPFKILNLKEEIANIHVDINRLNQKGMKK